MKKIVTLVVCFLFSFGSSAFALTTHYNNRVGYENRGGYNNKIPYSAFFNGHGPRPQEKAIQIKDGQRRVQKVIHVNTPEEEIEPQTIK